MKGEEGGSEVERERERDVCVWVGRREVDMDMDMIDLWQGKRWKLGAFMKEVKGAGRCAAASP